MLDKIEMSLEDIIKQNKSGKSGGRGGRGGRSNFGKSTPNKKSFGSGGGVAKGRGRGGIARSQYTRVR